MCWMSCGGGVWLTVLSVVLAVDGRGWCLLGLEAECGIANLSWQAKLKVEDASLAAVFALGAARADHGSLVTRTSSGQPSKHGERPTKNGRASVSR